MTILINPQNNTKVDPLDINLLQSPFDHYHINPKVKLFAHAKSCPLLTSQSPLSLFLPTSLPICLSHSNKYYLPVPLIMLACRSPHHDNDVSPFQRLILLNKDELLTPVFIVNSFGFEPFCCGTKKRKKDKNISKKKIWFFMKQVNINSGTRNSICDI